MPRSRYLFVCLSMLAGASAMAQAPPVQPGEFALCPPNPVLAPPPQSVTGKAPFPAVVDADRVRGRRNGVIRLSGNVVATRGHERFWAQLVEFNRLTNILTGHGNLRYASPAMSIEAKRGKYNFATDRGTFYDNRYQLPARHGRGKAQRIDTYASNKTGLSGLTYTTCPPHHVAWRLHAKQVTLNHDTEIGYAHNAWLSFMGVPFLWTPYLSFPLTDQRKSGFLAPSISNNSTSGIDLEVPYYFNLAPNMDMTFTPRIITRRGLMAMDTYRWLLPGTVGQVHLEYLPHDRETNSTRGLFNLDDTSQITSNWRLETNLEYISDPNYLDDFGTSLRRIAQSYQTRQVKAIYQVSSGSAVIQFADYAPNNPAITPAERPYRKLPEIGLNFSWPNFKTGFTPVFHDDFTRFEAPAEQGGLRNDLRPSISWDLDRGSWYLTPAFALDQDNYRLDAFDGKPAGNINRTTPIFSFDSGLRFERTLGEGGWLTQTLEPRINYLYVPYRDQSDIPIFDTYLPPLDMERLFATNRFVGPDRLGDANRVSLGLTTRFLDNATGTELFTLGIGQSFYFQNRDVTLPGEAPQTNARSDYVGEFTANISSHISTRLVADYNPYSHDFDQGYLAFQYHPSTYTVLNLGYLYRRGDLDQTNVSFSLPITKNWSVVGRWNYSVRDHQTLETLAGIQYETCCWRIRLATRRFVTLDGQGSSAILLQLGLIGLGGLGEQLSDFYHDDIYGYGENPNP
ncbi:MAG: LPS-assembly protein LptD [Gammaproteobacteria bacterium]